MSPVKRIFASQPSNLTTYVKDPVRVQGLATSVVSREALNRCVSRQTAVQSMKCALLPARWMSTVLQYAQKVRVLPPHPFRIVREAIAKALEIS